MARESIVYQRMDKYCVHSRIERIENLVKKSTPDMFVQNRNTNCWVEAKNVKIGIRARLIKMPMEDGQYNWAVSNVRFGGKVLLGIVADDAPYNRDGLFFSLVPVEYIEHSTFVEAFMEGRCGDLCYVLNKDLDKFFLSI